MPEVLNAFRGGLRYYRAGEMDRALAQFHEALALHPGDAVSAIFAERCEHLKEVGVPEDWNGIWVMKTK
jgi:adenylate cyclase